MEELSGATHLICNTQMWELIKNENLQFDSETYHKLHNIYQLAFLVF